MTTAAALETRVAATDAEERLSGLIAAARAGDRAALEALVQSIERRVYVLAYRLVGDASAAEDVAQEVFLKICRRLSQFREGGNFWGWVYRITVNQVRDWWRSANLPALELLDRPAPPGFSPAQDEQLRRVTEAMRALTEKERAALVLTEIEGFSSAEAARILGTLAINVRTRASQARKKVRRELSRYYPELREAT